MPVYRRLIFLAALMSGQLSFAQTGIETPYLFTENHFSIGLVNSLNKSSFVNTYGSDKPYSGFGNIHELRLRYRFNLDQRFGIGIETGFGFFPSITYLDSQGDFSGTEGWRYAQIVNYYAYGHAAADFCYRFRLNDELVVSSSVAVGARFFPELGSGFSSNGPVGENYRYDEDFEGRPNPFVRPEIGLHVPLKNKNLLLINFNFCYSFSRIYEGEFRVYDGASGGDHYNNGHSIGLGLDYVFTRAKQAAFRAEWDTDTEPDKASKKKWRQDKRFIDPKAIVFGGGTGIFYSRPKFATKDHGLITHAAPAWNVHAVVQVGLRKNFFVEGAWNVQKYYGLVYPEALEGQFGFYIGTGGFIGNEINAGLGYRWINPATNYNYLTFSAGTGGVILFGSKGIHMYGGGSSGYPYEANYMQYSGQDRVERNFVPTVYGSVSKDFRLSSALLFSINWRYTQGFLAHSSTDLFYTVGTSGSTTYVRPVADGTGNSFLVSFRYIFNPEKEKP